MEELIFPKIVIEKKAYQSWEILATAYQGKNKVKITKFQILQKNFETLWMESKYYVDHFMSQTMNLVNQLQDDGEDVSY